MGLGFFQIHPRHAQHSLGLVRESIGGPWIRQALIPFYNLGPNTTPQNWLVRWGVPHFYILSSRVLSLLKSHITVAWTIICGCFQSYIQRRLEDTDNWQRWWGYRWDVQRRLWRSVSAIYNWKHNIFKNPIFFIFEFSYHAIIYLIVQLIRPVRRTGRQSSMWTCAKHGLEFSHFLQENIVIYQVSVKAQHCIKEWRLNNN